MPTPSEIRESIVQQWMEHARNDLAWAEKGAADPALPGPA